MMCAHCEDLAERVAYLESELALREDADELRKLRVAFGVRPSAARLIRALFNAKGRPVTRWQLLEQIPGNEDRNLKIIDVYVCHLRKVFGREGIENIWGQGYRLSGEAALRVGAILLPQQSAAA
jgi:DNA-binding response OmpR family regulator